MANLMTRKKIIWGMVAAASLALTALIVRQNQKPAQSRAAYFPVSRCINMGNGLEAPIEGEWGYSFRQSDFAKIKAAGFDTVRIPIKWSAHAQLSPPYAIESQFISRVGQIVDWGLAAQLNVIINVHHYDGLYENPNLHEPRLVAIWAQIASHFRDQPQNLIFEIINEPREKFSGGRVNRVQAEALVQIRKTNPSRTVIFTGDEWGSLSGMKNLRLPDDPYLVATVHYYNPFEFTHQGASFIPIPPPIGREWPMDGEMELLARDIAKVVAFGNRVRAPVLLGEYGVTNEVPMRLRAAWAYDVTRALKAANIPACYFNFASGFASYNLENKSWNKPLLDALELP
ncbi:MAG: endoglucanase [Hyphomonadaceae bacterium]|nr:MAG: endoglucanase [Hyphomonadaceae bacterium]KAF0183261.1 MAG: endoglucanase [Hyphomonadaceae bacterium]